MDNILNLEHIFKFIDKTTILNDICLSLSAGEIVGFIGPNGSGKSSTMKIITSLWQASSGQVLIANKNINTHREEALADLSAMIEYPMLYSELSGHENLKIIAWLRNVNNTRINEIESLIELRTAIHKPVKTYSLGMKQRLMLGMCLLPKPKLLLLDEPTNGLDPNGVSTFLSLIKEHANKDQTAVLISSHQLHHLENLCDRFIYIKNGTIITPTYNSSYTRYQLMVDRPLELDHMIKTQFECETTTIENGIIITIDQKTTLNMILQTCHSNNIMIKQIDRLIRTIEEEYSEIYQ
ncbi:MAG: ABC transporter ATP-binding protein [Erysipelotrichaceae bacterium]|nr:ABC transporter ATP-binding protein [Erysipelotrichaceae bacterium]